MENFLTLKCINRVTLNYIEKNSCLSLIQSMAKHFLLIDFLCTSLVLLKPNLHTVIYDDTWFSYFTNQLVCDHPYEQKNPKL